jgi:hypothetical protein
MTGSEEAKPLTSSRFVQHKPKVVAKRYIRSSPPRESAPAPLAASSRTTPTLAQQQPEQTRTGLILTKPYREKASPSPAIRYDSADLALSQNSAKRTPSMDRAKSASSGALCAAGASRKMSSNKLPDFSHVESKVKQYINSVKSMAENGGSGRQSCDVTGKSMQKSKSCGNLSPSKLLRQRRNSLAESPRTIVVEYQRPRTAPPLQERLPPPNKDDSKASGTDNVNCDSDDEDGEDGHVEENCGNAAHVPHGGRPISQAHSRSVPNLSSSAGLKLRRSAAAGGGGGLSKSAVSLAALGSQIGDLIDSEDSDYEAKVLRYFSRDNLNEIVIESEDLIHLGAVKQNYFLLLIWL